MIPDPTTEAGRVIADAVAAKGYIDEAKKQSAITANAEREKAMADELEQNRDWIKSQIAEAVTSAVISGKGHTHICDHSFKFLDWPYHTVETILTECGYVHNGFRKQNINDTEKYVAIIVK